MKVYTREQLNGCLFFILFVTVSSYSDPFFFCGTPQLCNKETRLRTVFAEVGDNITFNFCFISGGNLTLRKAGLGFERKKFLDEERFITNTTSQQFRGCYQHIINATIYNVQMADFGPIVFELLHSGISGVYGLTNYAILLLKKGITFNIYKSLHEVTTSNVFSPGQSLYLMCESNDHSASSLSIVKKYSKEILDTRVTDGALVYHFESIQCSHMGTYVCFYNNVTSQNSTLDVVLRCPPQLCPSETKTRTIFAAVNENVNIHFCVISWGIPSLNTVFQNGNSMNKLPASRYRDSSISAKATHEHKMHYWNVNVVLRDIQEKDFSKTSVVLSFYMSTPLIYEIVLANKDFEFRAEGSSPSPLNISENLTLKCKTEGLQSSSLNIVKKGSKEFLMTKVINGSLVYTIESLKCQDTGTYLCLYNNDTSQNVALDVHVTTCAPQLCPEENQTRTQTLEVNSDLNIFICVISDDEFFLERVFLNGKEDKILEKNRYKPYNSSEITGEDMYHSVDIEMYNITEEDFGRVTFRLTHVSVLGLRLDYEITLQQTTHTEGLQETERNPANEFTRDTSTPRSNSSIPYEPTTANDDSSMIYIISGVCTFMALVLAGNFIYCQIRKRCYRTSSSQIKKESTDHLPVPSQQWTPYGYSVTLYENAAAEQLQEMLHETDDDGYLRPGPIYESIE